MSWNARLVVAVTAVLAVGGATVVGWGPRSDPPSAAGTPTEATGPEAPPSAPATAPTPATPSAEPSPAPAPPPDRDRLVERLEAILDRDDLAVDGRVAVAIFDGHGRELVRRVATEPLLPASTLKSLTAAAALTTLGPDHRFLTTVRTRSRPSSDGTVEGDLVLLGVGDPVLSTEGYSKYVYPARPITSLDALADRVVAAGVRRVTGDVVGDSSLFATDPLAAGWKPEYLWDFDARRIRSLTVDAGLDYTIDAPEPDLELTLTLAGDPAAAATAALYTRLLDRGVVVDGGVRTSDRPIDAPHVVVGVASPPLENILRHMMRRSDNHVADTLFRVLGSVAAPDATWDVSALTVKRTLRELGVRTAGLVLADGSGLSRNDRVTADALARVETLLATSERAATWTSLMAVAGEEGTLRRRLRGTPAQGRFVGKTGTLDDVRAVVGTVLGDGPDTYHLAVIANDVTGAERARIAILIDELALALTADLLGCAFATPPAATAASPGDASEPPGPRVSTVTCPTG